MLRTFTLAPLDPTSIEAVTYKTFVLTALSIGARMGEFCALRCGQFIRPAEYWSFLLLYSDPSFIPKMAKERLLPGRRHGPVPGESIEGLYGNNCGPLVC